MKKLLIFKKDWKQIGCKSFSLDTKEEEILTWLSANHNNIKGYLIKNV